MANTNNLPQNPGINTFIAGSNVTAKMGLGDHHDVTHIEWDCPCGQHNVVDFIFATWLTCPGCNWQWEIGGWDHVLRGHRPMRPAK